MDSYSEYNVNNGRIYDNFRRVNDEKNKKDVLVNEGTSFYEIDMDCVRRKKEQKF